MPAKKIQAKQMHSENMKVKSFKLFDAVLAAVCVILVVESAAPTAAIGNSQYFWWAFMFITFFIPYGLVTAELGAAYRDKGGLFDWVQRAFGRNWGSRVAWYYWIQFVFWLASLAVLFTEVSSQIMGRAIPVWTAVIVQLAFIVCMCVGSMMPISVNKWLINLGTYAKVLLMTALGVFGLYCGIVYGFANPVTGAGDLLPSFAGVSFIAVIIFNFKGFEVVAAFTGDMDNPKKQIPMALLLGGILISFFYIFAAFGISAAIPVAELTTYGGLVDSFVAFFTILGLPGHILVPIVGILFLFTLFINVLSWALGVNYVASHAAEQGAMPKVFAKRNAEGAPLGASVLNGVVAGLMVIAVPFIPNPDIFWGFFALQIITLILAYMFMFPVFKKLRKIDPDAERPFRIPGGKAVINIITYMPVAMLTLSAIFSMVYPLADGVWYFDSMLVIGTVAAVFIGELIVYTTGRSVKAKLPAHGRRGEASYSR
ncbi:MAG: APC family permease [Defluviitaleaceae bacterium]|nr:APC family permease [Defluviitaleaceae bacterium]